MAQCPPPLCTPLCPPFRRGVIGGRMARGWLGGPCMALRMRVCVFVHIGERLEYFFNPH